MPSKKRNIQHLRAPLAVDDFLLMAQLLCQPDGIVVAHPSSGHHAKAATGRRPFNG